MDILDQEKMGTTLSYTGNQSSPAQQVVAKEKGRASISFKSIVRHLLAVIGVLYLVFSLYVMFVENMDVGLYMLLIPLGIVMFVVGAFLLYLAYLFIAMLIYAGVKLLKYIVPAVFLYYFLKMIVTAYIQAS